MSARRRFFPRTEPGWMLYTGARARMIRLNVRVNAFFPMVSADGNVWFGWRAQKIAIPCSGISGNIAIISPALSRNSIPASMAAMHGSWTGWVRTTWVHVLPELPGIISGSHVIQKNAGKGTFSIGSDVMERYPLKTFCTSPGSPSWSDWTSCCRSQSSAPSKRASGLPPDVVERSPST